MARASSLLGQDEPPPVPIAKSDAVRDIPMDTNEPGELDSEQQSQSVEPGDKAASTVSSADRGGDNDGNGDNVSRTSSSKEKERKKRATVSSTAGGRIGKGRASVCNRPYIPLHAFTSFISDLHMKTPQEILEKVRPRYGRGHIAIVGFICTASQVPNLSRGFLTLGAITSLTGMAFEHV